MEGGSEKVVDFQKNGTLQEATAEGKRDSDTGENHYKQILRIKAVYILAAFLLCYVGVEVSLASASPPSRDWLVAHLIFPIGWSVTYVINVRGGGNNSGYVSTGLFGGE
jgi:hypothetical protein